MLGKIVVADSSRTVRRMAEISLDRHPFQIVFATDGQGALRSIGEQRPALALIDATLPGVDGYEVARQVKSNPSTAHTRVLLLVGRNSRFDSARARQSGVDGQVPKPFLTQKLVEVAFEAVGQSAPDQGLFKSTLLNIPLARKDGGTPPAAFAGLTNTGSQPALQSTPAMPAAQAAPRAPSAPSAPPPTPAARPSLPPTPPAGIAARPAAPQPQPPLPRPPAPRTAPPSAVVPAPPPRAPTAPPAEAFTEASAPASAAVPKAPAANQAQVGNAATVQALLHSPELVKALAGVPPELIEAIAWEVVPKLAEAILKEEIARVVRARLSA
jgi:CheY-like chemotaxis protein